MCEFKPGDEVVCIRSEHGREGMTFTVAAYVQEKSVIPSDHFSGLVATKNYVQLNELPWVDKLWMKGNRKTLTWGYDAASFRKVQRRDLSAWLKTATTFEEPKRKKARA